MIDSVIKAAEQIEEIRQGRRRLFSREEYIDLTAGIMADLSRLERARASDLLPIVNQIRRIGEQTGEEIDHANDVLLQIRLNSFGSYEEHSYSHDRTRRFSEDVADAYKQRF